MLNKGISIYLKNGQSHTVPLPENFGEEGLKSFKSIPYLRIKLSEDNYFVIDTDSIDCILVGPIEKNANS